MRPQLSFIIVTYNSAVSIGACLKSIEKNVGIEHEIILVDNDSHDNTVEIVSKFKKVTLLRQTQNLGFSKSCNIGAAKAQSDILFFLNPDTQFLKNDLARVLDYLKNNKQVGIVAPALILDDMSIQPSVRNLPTLSRAIREYWFKQPNVYSEYVPIQDHPTEVESVVGAALIIPTRIFHQVKGFSEKFFLYYEDLDLCKKILDAGLKVIYYPELKIRHTVGVSSRTNPRSLSLLKESAKIYHGVVEYFLTYFIIRSSQILKKLTS